MFEGLRTVFASKPAVPEPEAGPGDGKVTLGDVLRRNWFELWYQPKIDLRSKRLVGAEGLVRARRPDGGVISPALFLPGAKEADMLALTERVIVTALRDFEDCAALGASVKLSVNVPVSAFVKLPIAQILREQRPSAPTWPGLILEVTEDEAMKDLKIANDVADQLRALSCTLALDDFGAGYSSLARLRQCRSASSRSTGAMSQTAMSIASMPGCARPSSSWPSVSSSRPSPRASKRCTKISQLQGIGCDIGQGYLFAKPMPKADFLGALGRRMVGGPRPAAPPRSAPAKFLRGLFAET